ncbi:MAG: hypothetical protein QOC81_2705 [Thermoanaerobaculia bacterium]|jgi:hypothetical protein|nr:hypothetical protein [Thermoanaerobaculia bacterium]
MGGALMSEVPTEVPPTEVPPPELPPPAVLPKFNVLAMFGGLLLSIILGAIGNVVAGFASVSSGAKVFGFLIGVVPGAIFVAVAALLRRKTTAFATGLFIGGCLVGLIGGICGSAMVGFSVR